MRLGVSEKRGAGAGCETPPTSMKVPLEPGFLSMDRLPYRYRTIRIGREFVSYGNARCLRSIQQVRRGMNVASRSCRARTARAR
jgi:hypothetical protein